MLAIAADIPELGIAISSALNGVSEVSVGDLIGANFTDVALVIGFTLLLSRQKIHIDIRDREKILRMLLITALVLVAVFAIGTLTRIHGLILIGIYAAAITWLWKRREAHDILHQEVDSIQHDVAATKDVVLTSVAGMIIKLCASLGLVMVASSITVHYAMCIATDLCLPLETVGATILGVGTSLPELCLSLNALRRGQHALAIGPTLGTVLGQTTLILGILATLSHKPVQMSGLRGAALFMFAAFGIVCYGLTKDKRMGRGMGAALLALFVAYMVYQIH